MATLSQTTNPAAAATEDLRKMQELILHICRASENDESFGAVKLNKLLFYSDFAAYRSFGRSITGQEYQRRDKGPVPRPMYALMDEMQKTSQLAIASRDYFGYPQKRPVALREPDLSSFTSDEIALVDRAISHFRDKNATELSEASHQFIGWKQAREGKPFLTVSRCCLRTR